MSDGAVSTKTARRTNKSKCPKEEPADLENQENSSAQVNAQVIEKPIQCPDCDRRFQKPCHLKFHSVIHKPGRENTKSGKNRSGGSKKAKVEKAKPEAGASKSDVVAAPEKRRSRDTEICGPIRVEVQEVASSARAPFSDVSNGEVSSPAPGSVGSEEPPPLVWSAHVQPPPEDDARKLEISVEEHYEFDPAATASAVQIENDSIIPSAESFDETEIEPSPEYTPEAIEGQQGDPLDLEEDFLEEDLDDSSASLNRSYCSICEEQLGVQCSMRRVGLLSPIVYPYVDNQELFVEGSSQLLEEIEKAEKITSEEDYLTVLELISKGGLLSYVAGLIDAKILLAHFDSMLDHCEDLVPDDFYEVLESIALQQQNLEG